MCFNLQPTCATQGRPYNYKNVIFLLNLIIQNFSCVLIFDMTCVCQGRKTKKYV